MEGMGFVNCTEKNKILENLFMILIILCFSDHIFFFNVKNWVFGMAAMPFICRCYKSVHSFRVTCLFSGQYNTKGYDGTITYVILRPDKYNNYINVFFENDLKKFTLWGRWGA